MRRTVQVLFLLFYIAASYAISQDRTSFLVSELQHSNSREGKAAIGTGRLQPDAGAPIFRQAKPLPICALEIGQDQIVQIRPQVSEPVGMSQLSSPKALSSFQAFLDRAPPSRS